MKNREVAEQLNQRVETLKQAGVKKADSIFDQIAGLIHC